MRIVVPWIPLLLLVPIPAMAVEEPAYETLAETADYAVRRYPSYVVAEMIVESSFEAAGGRAFRPLARFISGANVEAARIEMTAPVTQRSERGERIGMTAPVTQRSERGERIGMTAPVTQRSEGGERIGMTAPVTQRASPEGGYAVQFVMPARYTLETVPRPEDSRIRLRQEPEKVVAVLRYTGTWSEERYRRNQERLRRALARDGRATSGDPVWARFDPPFKLWFLRRNEIWWPIAWRAETPTAEPAPNGPAPAQPVD